MQNFSRSPRQCRNSQESLSFCVLIFVCFKNILNWREAISQAASSHFIQFLLDSITTPFDYWDSSHRPSYIVWMFFSRHSHIKFFFLSIIFFGPPKQPSKGDIASITQVRSYGWNWSLNLFLILHLNGYVFEWCESVSGPFVCDTVHRDNVLQNANVIVMF